MVVTDSAGISKENQQLLFQEGMQFDPEKLQTGGGSGFGLFISKSIVELHGGTMEVFSQGESKGCSFLYRIPMKRKVDVQKSAGESARLLAAPLSPNFPRIRSQSDGEARRVSLGSLKQSSNANAIRDSIKQMFVVAHAPFRSRPSSSKNSRTSHPKRRRVVSDQDSNSRERDRDMAASRLSGWLMYHCYC